jgi:hypothetical protein
LLLVCGSAEAQESINQRVVVVNTVQLVGLVVELGQAVARTVHNAEDLGQGQDKIGDLRNEKQHHSLAEVAQDAHDCESLTGEVAERVSNEDLAREGVLLEQSECRQQERNHQCQTEHVCIVGFL